MEKAERYWARAEDLRRVADGMPEGNVERMVLGLVMQYEQLAKRLLEEGPSEPLDSKITTLRKPEGL